MSGKNKEKWWQIAGYFVLGLIATVILTVLGIVIEVIVLRYLG